MTTGSLLFLALFFGGIGYASKWMKDVYRRVGATLVVEVDRSMNRLVPRYVKLTHRGQVVPDARGGYAVLRDSNMAYSSPSATAGFLIDKATGNPFRLGESGNTEDIDARYIVGTLSDGRTHAVATAGGEGWTKYIPLILGVAILILVIVVGGFGWLATKLPDIAKATGAV